MFKRRNKLSPAEMAREWIWPRSGWFRWLKYHRYRVLRLPDNAYNIAAGLACGTAISFTPFIGLHIALALGAAYMLRANLFAAAVGTAVGNPWTFPFIWLLTYRVGALFLGLDTNVALADVIDADLILSEPWAAIAPAFWPMALGGVIVMATVWWITFLSSKRLISGYQHRRRLRLSGRRQIISRLREKGGL